MKKVTAIVLVVVFVMAFAVPVFAQNMVHTVKEEYVDAVIDIERQHGHLCNTGAALKYTVKGSAAEFLGERAITQVEGKITVSKDEAGWVAGATPLTVTSVIELCAPAKHEYTTTYYVPAASGGQPPRVTSITNPGTDNHNVEVTWGENITFTYDPEPIDGFLLQGGSYQIAEEDDASIRMRFDPAPAFGNVLTILAGAVISDETGLPNEEEIWFYSSFNGSGIWTPVPTSTTSATNAWRSYEVDSGVVDPSMGYLTGWGSFYHSVPNPGPGQVYGSLIDLLVAETTLTFADLAGLTAAQVRDLALAEGFAYYITELEGLTEQIWAVQVQSEPGYSGNLEQTWEAAYGPYEGWKLDGPDTEFGSAEGTATHDEAFGFRVDEDGYIVVELGTDYVGNYFNIDQHARTSQGHVYRYIDISSPWSHAFVREETYVTGKADVQEAFAMNNLGPGADVATDWWDLF